MSLRNEKMRIYIAEPYAQVRVDSHQALQKAAHSVDRAIQAAIAIDLRKHLEYFEN